MTLEQTQNLSREMGMDDFTIRHLESWLNREVRELDALDAVRAAMLAEYANDPSYYDREGWQKLYDAVNGFAIEQAVSRG